MTKSNINNLLELMARLRAPRGGCPWDLEQTFATIAPFTIEEAYEVADAIEHGDMRALKSELGDLLFQVVYHAQLAAEAGEFVFDDVVAAICEKLVRRHPHVFADAEIADARAHSAAWEEIKAAERDRGGGILRDIPVALPALTRSLKLGRRAAQVGFDWPDFAGVRAKITEELHELDEAIESADRDRIGAELGDTLFALVNACRHLDVDPEACLRRANTRFQRRFESLERVVRCSDRDWEAFDLDELEALWIAAKNEAG